MKTGRKSEDLSAQVYKSLLEEHVHQMGTYLLENI